MAWEIFDRFYNAHWFLTGYSTRFFPELLRLGNKKQITKFIGVMKNGVNAMIFDDRQFNHAADFFANKLVNDDRWHTSNYKKFYHFANKYFKAGERLRKLNFAQMSDNELLNEFKKILPLQSQVRILGITLNGLVIDGRNHLSNKIRHELKAYIPEDKFDEYWSLLTQVTKLSFRQKKDIAIARLATYTKKLSSDAMQKRLKNIYERYCWLDYMYQGPAISFEQFEKELEVVRNVTVHLNPVSDIAALKKKQEQLMRKLRFNQRARFLVGLAQQVIWQKGYRKDVEYHGFWSYEPLFRELARRKGESDWKTLLFLFPWELEGFIIKGLPSTSELKQRRKFSVFITTETQTQLITGEKAERFYKTLNLEKDLSKITATQGQCAFGGKAIGIVKIVQIPEDMSKMEIGNILVSQATSPDLIPAMRKAAAIVTNTGGLIAHAAITARELKIPCVVGTVNATAIFKDGDRIEVDATKGIVRKI